MRSYNKNKKSIISLEESFRDKKILRFLFEETDDEKDDTDDSDNQKESDNKDNEDVEKNIETSTEDQIRLKNKLDAELGAIFTGFETRARKSATMTSESRKRSLLQILIENEVTQNDEFNIDQFADDTARLIQNYDTLLDMEAIILNKAKQFLIDKYGVDFADKLKDILVDRYNIDFFIDTPSEEDPIAIVGTGGGGGGIA